MDDDESDFTHDCTKKVVMMRVMSDPMNFRAFPILVRLSFMIYFLRSCFGEFSAEQSDQRSSEGVKELKDNSLAADICGRSIVFNSFNSPNKRNLVLPLNRGKGYG